MLTTIAPFLPGPLIVDLRDGNPSQQEYACGALKQIVNAQPSSFTSIAAQSLTTSQNMAGA